IDAPRHAENPGEVQRVEREVEADDEQPEMPAAERLVEHPAGGLGEPVIDAGEQREQQPAEQDVVKVRDDEVGVAQLPVERRRGEANAAGASRTPDSPGTRN